MKLLIIVESNELNISEQARLLVIQQASMEIAMFSLAIALKSFIKLGDSGV